MGLIIWFAPFFVWDLAIPISLLVWFLVQEPAKRRNQQSARVPRLFERHLQKKTPFPFLLLAGAVGLSPLWPPGFISDELESYRITGVMKGLVLAIPVTAMTITSYTSGLALQQRDEWLKPAVAAGLVAVGAGLAALGLTTGLRALLAWASFMGIGVGVMLPALNTLITGATDAQERIDHRPLRNRPLLRCCAGPTGLWAGAGGASRCFSSERPCRRRLARRLAGQTCPVDDGLDGARKKVSSLEAPTHAPGAGVDERPGASSDPSFDYWPF